MIQNSKLPLHYALEYIEEFGPYIGVKMSFYKNNSEQDLWSIERRWLLDATQRRYVVALLWDLGNNSAQVILA